MNRTRQILAWVFGLLAIGFGALTLKTGGTVLFGPPAAREAAGDYVPFVLWFNFTAGVLYVIGGISLVLRRSETVWLAGFIAIATLLVFVAFGWHLLSGGAYELRTVRAMTLRSVFWMIMTGIAWFIRQPSES